GALVGLAVLGGVLVATRNRPILAALLFTAAALIKAPAGLALVAYLAWLAYQRGTGAFLRAAGVVVGIALVTLLFVGGGNAVGPLIGSREFILPHSPWTLFASGGIQKAIGYGYVDLGSLEHLSTVGVVTGVVIGAIFVASRLRDTTPLYIAAGALLAYLFISVYTAPWYAGWVFPLLALSWRWRVSLYAFVFFAVLMIDDRFGDAVFPQVLRREHTFQVLLANWINTLAMLAAIGGVVVLLWFRRSGSPSEAHGGVHRVEHPRAAPARPAAHSERRGRRAGRMDRVRGRRARARTGRDRARPRFVGGAGRRRRRGRRAARPARRELPVPHRVGGRRARPSRPPGTDVARGAGRGGMASRAPAAGIRLHRCARRAHHHGHGRPGRAPRPRPAAVVRARRRGWWLPHRRRPRRRTSRTRGTHAGVERSHDRALGGGRGPARHARLQQPRHG